LAIMEKIMIASDHGPNDYRAVSITTPLPSTGADNSAHQFRVDLAPGQTRSLADVTLRGCEFIPLLKPDERE
jgi:hypothetical protein